MKYIHKFDSVEAMEAAYNDGVTVGSDATSIVIEGKTYYYSYSENGYYYWEGENTGEWARTDLRNPSANGSQAAVTQDNWNTYYTGYPIEEVERDVEPTAGLYIEPWLACVSGATGSVGTAGLTYNRGQQIAGIDLGLPSGLIWAKFNVGARFPEECGNYYAWGETTPKSTCTWANYKYATQVDGEPGSTAYTDYETTKYNYEDDKYQLEPEDDAAVVNWGNGWRMPTYDEYVELMNHTVPYEGEVNGVYGALLRSESNSALTLFFPEYGSVGENGVEFEHTFGRYWCSELNDPLHPFMLGWCSHSNPGIYVHDDSIMRQLGCLVRAVKEPAGYNNDMYLAK